MQRLPAVCSVLFPHSSIVESPPQERTASNTTSTGRGPGARVLNADKSHSFTSNPGASKPEAALLCEYRHMDRQLGTAFIQTQPEVERKPLGSGHVPCFLRKRITPYQRKNVWLLYGHLKHSVLTSKVSTLLRTSTTNCNND